MRAPGSPAAGSDSGEALRNLQRQFLEGVALAEASPPPFVLALLLATGREGTFRAQVLKVCFPFMVIVRQPMMMLALVRLVVPVASKYVPQTSRFSVWEERERERADKRLAEIHCPCG